MYKLLIVIMLFVSCKTRNNDSSTKAVVSSRGGVETFAMYFYSFEEDTSKSLVRYGLDAYKEKYGKMNAFCLYSVIFNPYLIRNRRDAVAIATAARPLTEYAIDNYSLMSETNQIFSANNLSNLFITLVAGKESNTFDLNKKLVVDEQDAFTKKDYDMTDLDKVKSEKNAMKRFSLRVKGHVNKKYRKCPQVNPNIAKQGYKKQY